MIEHDIDIRRDRIRDAVAHTGWCFDAQEPMPMSWPDLAISRLAATIEHSDGRVIIDHDLNPCDIELALDLIDSNERRTLVRLFG